MHTRLRRRLFQWFAIVLALMLGAAGMAAWAIYQARQGEGWVIHTRDVIDTLNEISIALGDAESNARAYVQTGNTRHLATFESQKIQADQLARDLAVLAADNGPQARRAAALLILLKEDWVVLDKIVMAAGETAGTANAADPAEGVMSRARAHLAAMKGEEQRLLAERTARTETAQRFALSLGSAALLLNVIIIHVVFTRIRGESAQRQSAEEELQAANRNLQHSLEQVGMTSARLAKTLENIPLGVLLMDADLRIVAFNDRFLEMLALPPALVKAGDSIDAILEHGLARGDRSPEEVAATRARRRALRNNPVAHRFDLQLRDGRLIEAQGTPIPGGGFVTIYTDITRQRAEAERLDAARRAAEETTRAKSEFLAVMSHEVRTPMNGVLGLAELLLDTPLSRDQRNSVETILRSGENLMDILNDILDFSKIEADRIELEAEPFRLNDVVGDMVTLWGSRASEKGLALTLEIEPDCPADLVGDSGRLRQVLSNLIGNAVKFTGHGRIGLAVKAASRAGEEVLIQFAVADTGIGMTAEQQQRLFQPFSQADASTTRKFGGTGLGLVISQRLAERLGGSITVESAQGTGSTFTLQARFVVGKPGQAVPVPRTADAEPRFKGKVLVVEDQPVNRAVARANLQRFGLTVVEAVDGEEGLRLLEQESVDLVFMDMHMPGIDGLTATRKLRGAERNGARSGHLPIIAMTANVLPEAVQACLAAGMDDFLPKPFSRQQLTHILLHWLAASAAGGRIVEPASPEVGQNARVIDPERFKLLKETMMEELDELLDDFQSSTEVLLGTLYRESKSGNLQRVVAIAHNIGSSAATIGAMRMSAAARRIEDLQADVDPEKWTGMAQELREEFRAFCAALAAADRTWETHDENSGR